ncbi:DUF378 domain-containing protein [Candidatus Nomurabacteria bacterium]|nr:DUF378 domain-containing protein [Candidatus Nomurabacteria bacterium]
MCHGNWGGRCTTGLIAKILLVVGGINWGLVGVGMLMDADWNVINMLLGSWSAVEAIVYILVGIAAIVKIFGCRCKVCMAGCSCEPNTMDNANKPM